MKQIGYLIISLIFASWLGIIAVFSIQNITEVSLRFLLFESIKIPVGVLLSFSVGFGIILGTILPLFFRSNQSQPRKRRVYQPPLRENLEYFEEEDPLEDWDETRPETW